MKELTNYCQMWEREILCQQEEGRRQLRPPCSFCSQFPSTMAVKMCQTLIGSKIASKQMQPMLHPVLSKNHRNRSVLQSWRKGKASEPSPVHQLPYASRILIHVPAFSTGDHAPRCKCKLLTV